MSIITVNVLPKDIWPYHCLQTKFSGNILLEIIFFCSLSFSQPLLRLKPIKPISEPEFTCFKSTKETPEQCVKFVES